MTPLEEAESALASYQSSMREGHPWVPGGLFISNPGLDLYILAAFEGFVNNRRVAEQAKPARRVPLVEDPTWRPSLVAPEVPGPRVVSVEDFSSQDG